MGRSSGFSRSRPRSSGVARSWGVGPGASGLFQLTGTAAILVPGAISTTVSELTVMRLRGLFDIFLEGPTSADGDGMFGAAGIGVIADTAFDAGIASLPDPLSEIGWDGWLWHSMFSVHQPDVTFGGSPAASQRIVIDSKAMRKFDTEKVLFAVVAAVETGTAVINMRLFTRGLYQDSGR